MYDEPRLRSLLAAATLLTLFGCGDNTATRPDGGTPRDGAAQTDTTRPVDLAQRLDSGPGGDRGPDRSMLDTRQPADGGSTDLADSGPPIDAGSDTTAADAITADSAPADAGETPDAPAPDATMADSTPADAASCMVWEITYDLDRSEFEISDTPFGAGDQVNTVAAPYDAADHVGPGTMILRFADVGGSPGDRAWLVSYTMDVNFVVDSGVNEVETDLDNWAGPDACGVTTGPLGGTTVAWDPSALVGRRSVGQILCTGSFCSFGGLPTDTPVAIDETDDQPLSDFVFASDLSSFTMAKTVIAQDQYSTASWTYQGTETDRQLIAAPACLCP